MGRKKVDVSQENFVTSTEAVTAELAADAASEGGTNETTQEEETAEGTEEGISTTGDDSGDGAAVPAGEGEVISPFTSDGNQGPYVTRDPDFIGPTFTRSLPVPVPAEELAEHAKEQARLYGVREKALQDKKASNAGFTRLIKDTEAQLLTVSHVVEEGIEERPVVCRWEFDYSAGIKKLRRLDNHQIVDEETLQGDELQLSLSYNGSSEAAVEKLAELQATEGLLDSIDHAEPTTVVSACNGCQIPDPNCAECPDYKEPTVHEEQTPGSEAGDLTLPSGYPCKICGFDAGSHIYLVRHLRDVHALKLSEYKQQFPV